MLIKVNFGSEDSSTDDSILDSGKEYSSTQGYGWVTQDSFINGNPAPIDISVNTRDRDPNNTSNSDSLIHLQYPTNLFSPQALASNKIPSAWEYDIANGFYSVTVGVGDSDFTDSNHVVKVEGESIILGFVPTENELFAENTITVEITDGKLSLDALGGENTKLNFIEISPAEAGNPNTDGSDTPDNLGDVDGDTGNTDTDVSDTPDDLGDVDGDTGNTNTDGSDTPDDLGDVDGDTGNTDTDGSDTPDDLGDVDGDTGNTDIDGSEGFEVVRINFSPVTASFNSDSILDIGRAYSDGRSSGWVTQESIGTDNPTPIDISANTRDRNSIQEDDLDSSIHLQYSDSFENSNSVKTPAAWEYELANGQYKVTVSVGDPDFTDSNHVINIEGNNVIAGFTPTEDELFKTKTSIVDVSDGRLSIDAIGGENTKLNFVEIAAADDAEITDNPVEVTPLETPTSVGIPVEGGGVVEMVQPVPDGINVNFGAPKVNSDSGFTQDIGQAYSINRGFGWVTQDSAGSANPTPIDITANGRDRNTFFNDGQGGVFQEPVKDSLIHMQYPTGFANSDTSVTTPAAWEYELANGQYEVTVGVGDPDFFDSSHAINVEGQSVILGFVPTGFEVNGFLPLGAQAFSTGTTTVDVNDGRLTVDAIGGENTKINYISIVPVDSI